MSYEVEIAPAEQAERTVTFPPPESDELFYWSEPEYFLCIFRDAHLKSVEFTTRELKRVEKQIEAIEGSVVLLAERGDEIPPEFQELHVKRAKYRLRLKNIAFWHRVIVDGISPDEIDIEKHPSLWREFQTKFEDILTYAPNLLNRWQESGLIIYDLAETLRYGEYKKAEPPPAKPKRTRRTKSRSTTS